METRGYLAPRTEAEAKTTYDDLGSTAQTVTKEVARAMGFDQEEYRARVTGEVVETARDALFASLLEVTLGDRDEFDSWLDTYPSIDRHVEGSDTVEGRAWHHVPSQDAVAAVTFQNEPDAAVATVQRLAFGRFYRDLLDD